MFFVSFVFSQSNCNKIKTKGSTSEQLIRLDKEWTAAEMRGDKEIVDCIVADDFTQIDAEGKVSNKAQYMEDVKPSTSTHFYTENSYDYVVKIYGKTAVMTHRGTLKETDNSKTTEINLIVTHVWVKRNGRWQLVAFHETDYPQGSK
jgi:hypothetical protein